MQAGVEARHKAAGEALVAVERNDMLNAAFARDRNRAVRAAVVDDQVFDLVDTVYFFSAGRRRSAAA